MIKISDLEKHNLEKRTSVRFFNGDKARRQEFMKRYPDRWDNDSHFIRAACQYFMKTFNDMEQKQFEIKERKLRTKLKQRWKK
jgi:hypothetical protein